MRALRAAGFEVVGLVGRDPEKTAERAERFEVPSGLTSLDEALALPGVDAVTVATPPHTHASIVLDAKRGRKGGGKGRSAVLICGGGSPKNFILQTEPQIQEVLGIDEKGHDYFLQITDARPDTGGLSGATPAEAVSWGKIDPDRLPDAVVCYLDSTVALPLLTAYAHARHAARPLKRLFDRREEMLARLTTEYRKTGHEPAAAEDAAATLPMHR